MKLPEGRRGETLSVSVVSPALADTKPEPSHIKAFVGSRVNVTDTVLSAVTEPASSTQMLVEGWDEQARSPPENVQPMKRCPAPGMAVSVAVPATLKGKLDCWLPRIVTSGALLTLASTLPPMSTETPSMVATTLKMAVAVAPAPNALASSTQVLGMGKGWGGQLSNSPPENIQRVKL